MRTSEDEHDLIGICQQDLLILALRPGVQAYQSLLARLHGFDRPAAIRRDRDIDSITDCSEIARGFSVFQFASQLAKDEARTGFNCEEAGLGLDDQPWLN